MSRKGWYEALVSALQQEDTSVMQLATVDASGTPHVRSIVQRGFVTARELPRLPLLLATTDVRTPKVTQMADGRARVETVFWTRNTKAQFRILGRGWIVPEPTYDHGAYPRPGGVVYDALAGEGFDWEAKRVEVFDQMSGEMKATWCRPVPGMPLVGGEEEMARWPVTLPKLGEAKREEDRRNLKTALSNFALLLIEPFEVDYVELAVVPNRRTRFKRDWEDERSVEFEDTLLVP